MRCVVSRFRLRDGDQFIADRIDGRIAPRCQRNREQRRIEHAAEEITEEHPSPIGKDTGEPGVLLTVCRRDRQ